MRLLKGRAPAGRKQPRQLAEATQPPARITGVALRFFLRKINVCFHPEDERSLQHVSHRKVLSELTMQEKKKFSFFGIR